ncbi:MAG: bifunctional 4-hydroxy-2-oxoglutarate aldolase/2-dehydro-3-deoxy-phosphogluconate aldolase [Balneolaceae bacterium]
MSRNEITQRIEEKKLVAVVRTDTPEEILPVAEALLEGGVSIIELTMTIPNVLDHIGSVRKQLGTDALLGLGSVLNAETAQRAVDAGVQFVVSPIMKREIIDTAHKGDVPVAVGAYSPTEVQLAYEYGSDIVKVFPANQLGPSYIKAIRAPMPHLKIMPTGGVSKDNVHEWLDAGTAALGVGSALVDMKAIREKRFDVLTANARQFSESVQQYNRKN